VRSSTLFFANIRRRIGLVTAAPEGPGHDERDVKRRSEQEPREQIADFWNSGNERTDRCQAAIAWRGLVSFGLLDAVQRESAFNLARKAPAAMHKLM
jgi:hypothetical protein